MASKFDWTKLDELEARVLGVDTRTLLECVKRLPTDDTAALQRDRTVFDGVWNRVLGAQLGEPPVSYDARDIAFLERAARYAMRKPYAAVDRWMDDALALLQEARKVDGDSATGRWIMRMTGMMEDIDSEDLRNHAFAVMWKAARKPGASRKRARE